MVRRVELSRCWHRVELHLVTLTDVEAALDGAVEHVVADVADGHLRRFARLAVEFAQAFAQVLQTGVGQVADIGRVDVRGQPAEGELGKGDPRDIDGLGGVGEARAEFGRIERADDARGNRAELLIEVEATVHGRRHGGGIEGEHPAVMGDQVELPQGSDRHMLEHPIDRQIG